MNAGYSSGTMRQNRLYFGHCRFRHGRACPGHLSRHSAGSDCPDKPGHDRTAYVIDIQRMSCASPIGQNRTSCTFLVNGPNHLVL